MVAWVSNTPTELDLAARVCLPVIPLTMTYMVVRSNRETLDPSSPIGVRTDVPQIVCCNTPCIRSNQETLDPSSPIGVRTDVPQIVCCNTPCIIFLLHPLRWWPNMNGRLWIHLHHAMDVFSRWCLSWVREEGILSSNFKLMISLIFLSYVWSFILFIFLTSYILLWFILSIKKIESLLIFLHIWTNVLNKMSYQT
jgi:hypothetical protein